MTAPLKEFIEILFRLHTANEVIVVEDPARMPLDWQISSSVPNKQSSGVKGNRKPQMSRWDNSSSDSASAIAPSGTSKSRICCSSSSTASSEKEPSHILSSPDASFAHHTIAAPMSLLSALDHNYIATSVSSHQRSLQPNRNPPQQQQQQDMQPRRPSRRVSNNSLISLLLPPSPTSTHSTPSPRRGGTRPNKQLQQLTWAKTA